MAVPVMIASAVVAAYGAYEEGQAQKGMYQYQAGVARNNSIIASYNAQNATQVGSVLENTKRQQTAQTMATYRAKAGGAGVDLQSGSPLNVQGDIAGLGELDALTIRHNAAREAWGYNVAGQSYAAQAGADETASRNAETMGELGAFASILGGASTVSSRWSRMSTSGASPWST